MPASDTPNLHRHVILDYALVIAGFAGPWLLQFSHLPAATLYTLALAGFGLLLNLLTQYPGGVWKLIPFRWHRLVEWSSPFAFIVVPWVFFGDAGAMPWLLTAISSLIVLNATLSTPPVSEP